MPIYTKNGDQGETSLIGQGQKHKKSEPVFEVLGNLDELNSILGFFHTQRVPEISTIVPNIQNDLFSLGSYLAGMPISLEICENWEKKVIDLERLIDEYDAKNDPLKNFILPGGSAPGVWFHLARSVCRRCERSFVFYAEGVSDDTGTYVVFEKYLNRLSDLFFVLSRYTNKSLGVLDVVWEK